jgi:hypothetical protein
MSDPNHESPVAAEGIPKSKRFGESPPQYSDEIT